MYWNEVQKDAAAWLEAGRHVLEMSPQYDNHKRLEKRTGNYRWISQDNRAMVGETNNLRKRAKLLLKEEPTELSQQPTPFIQVSYTDFGRKELGEFPKSADQPSQQLGADEFSWDDLQAESLNLLSQGFQQLECVRPREWMARQAEAEAGVYMIFKQDELLYINHSDHLLRSLNLHSNSTPESVFRRAIATYELGLTLKTAEEVSKGDQGFNPYERHHLSLSENFEINHYLQDCLVINLPVSLGRIELAEALINHYSPKLMVKERAIT